MSNKTSVVLEEKIKSKLISAEENRVEKLNSYIEKLKEHVSLWASGGFARRFVHCGFATASRRSTSRRCARP